MRFLLLVALLLAFTAGGFADMAHASAGDHACANHQMDQDDNKVNTDNEPCHSEQDQSHSENSCDDCCCVHSHSMATTSSLNKTIFDVSKQNVIASMDHHYSAEVAGLKRPPRL